MQKQRPKIMLELESSDLRILQKCVYTYQMNFDAQIEDIRSLPVPIERHELEEAFTELADDSGDMVKLLLKVTNALNTYISCHTPVD